MNENFLLQKFVWSESDFEQMNWREATVYAVAFLPKRAEFVLDVDYILQRGEENENAPSFLVVPATLVFENVNDLKIGLEPSREIRIENIERGENWTVKTDQGEISLRAAGFKLHFKGMPVFGRNQSLDLDLRGGFSFSRVG